MNIKKNRILRVVNSVRVHGRKRMESHVARAWRTLGVLYTWSADFSPVIASSFILNSLDNSV
jgi:hypothetical protein